MQRLLAKVKFGFVKLIRKSYVSNKVLFGVICFLIALTFLINEFYVLLGSVSGLIFFLFLGLFVGGIFAASYASEIETKKLLRARRKENRAQQRSES